MVAKSEKDRLAKERDNCFRDQDMCKRQGEGFKRQLREIEKSQSDRAMLFAPAR